MSLTVIILLLSLGILLFVLEFLVFPGLTISGIGGMVSLGLAIFFSYHNFGVQVGNRVLIGTIISLMLVFIFIFRSKTIKRISLNETVSGSVTDTVKESNIQAGDTGKTITRLAPIGKVMVKGTVVEGKSTGEFIDENIEIEVIKINNNQIVVKIKKQ